MIYNARHEFDRHTFERLGGLHTSQVIDDFVEVATDDFIRLYKEQLEKEFRMNLIKSLFTESNAFNDTIVLKSVVDVSISVAPVIHRNVHLDNAKHVLDDRIDGYRNENIQHNETH